MKYEALENVLLIGKCGNISADMSLYDEIDWTNLPIQLELFRQKRAIKSVGDAVCVLKTMSPELRGEYSEVELLVRLLLVSPASSAEAERSFSALRRLKTWLRSTMSQQRLNHLAVCYVHQEVIDELNVNLLMADFILRNETRILMFGSRPSSMAY
jgi:hypothetical protein